MEKLPDTPTLESALFALSQLEGAPDYIAHIKEFIALQKADINYKRSTSTGRFQTVQADDQNINTESLKILDGQQSDDQSSDTPSSGQSIILIIEDDIEIGVMVKTIVENDGHVALLADTGPQGIALAEEYIPDLIICDVHLPGMHGLDIFRLIKAHDQLADVPFMMLTADIFKAEESYQIGVSEYILKPIRKNQLLSYIHKYI